MITTGLDEHQKAFVKLIEANARRYRRHEVFRDFCEMAAITLSNRVDTLKYQERETRFAQIQARYTPEEFTRFAHMLGCVTLSLSDGFNDCLGQLFMALELGDDFKGQFFTPASVASLMAALTLHGVESEIEREGFVTVNEPAVGAGVMVIAIAELIASKSFMYPLRMHAICQDIDQTAVHMSYIQLSLLGIPALVVHGNTLSMKEWDHWATPMHVLGGWDQRLNRRAQAYADHRAVQAAEAAASETSAESATTAEPSVDEAKDLRSVLVGQRVAMAEQLGLF